MNNLLRVVTRNMKVERRGIKSVMDSSMSLHIYININICFIFIYCCNFDAIHSFQQVEQLSSCAGLVKMIKTFYHYLRSSIKVVLIVDRRSFSVLPREC